MPCDPGFEVTALMRLSFATKQCDVFIEIIVPECSDRVFSGGGDDLDFQLDTVEGQIVFSAYAGAGMEFVHGISLFAGGGQGGHCQRSCISRAMDSEVSKN